MERPPRWERNLCFAMFELAFFPHFASFGAAHVVEFL